MKGNGFPYGDSIDVAEGFGNTLEYNDVNEMTIDKNFKKSVVSQLVSIFTVTHNPRIVKSLSNF